MRKTRDYVGRRLALLAPIKTRGYEMSVSSRLPLTEIPRDICKQELEIEAIVRSLVQFGDSGSPRRSQGRSNDALKHEATVWILMAVLGFICVIGFYLFWLKISGGIYCFD